LTTGSSLADNSQIDLSDALRVKLEASLAQTAGDLLRVGGVQNCNNKCEKTFDTTQYLINFKGNTTNEYIACLNGCAVCAAQIEKHGQSAQNSGDCFTVCKNTDWLNIPKPSGGVFTVVKGVVEPDKACIFGCIIQTCQGVCTGGTTEKKVTPQNKNLWWGTGGCSIKTGLTQTGGFYSQNSLYNYFNFPGGAGGEAQCCSNALSLCTYPGCQNGPGLPFCANPPPANRDNYNNLVSVAIRQCANVPAVPGGGKTVQGICAFFREPGHCGNPNVG